MTYTYDDVLARLAGVHEVAEGKATALCPAHADSEASLSIGTGRDGKLLLYCFVCRDFRRVLAALPAEPVEPDASNGHHAHGRGGYRRPRTWGERQNVVTRPYHYYDGNGALLAVHMRQDYYDAEGQPHKAIWWERNGQLGLDGLNLDDLPLYNLRALKDAPYGSRVVVVEGEKACEALSRAGVLTVATPGASVTPCDATLGALRDYKVVLWPDNDDAGRMHMQRIAAWLVAHGETPRWLDWPDAPDKGDAADYVAGGHKVAELDGLIRDVPGGRGRADQQRQQEQEAKHPQRDARKQAGKPLAFDWRSRDQTARALKGKIIVVKPYTVPNILPHGYTILGGRPKEGKTTLALQIGLAVASAKGLVLGGRAPEHGSVLYIALEETEARMQKRLGLMLGNEAAWPERFHLHFVWPDMQRGGLTAIDDFAQAYPDLALLIVDPFALFRGRANVHASYELDYQDSGRLGRWVNEHGVPLLLVTHTHQEQGEEPINLIQGTTGIVGPADNVLVMLRKQGIMTLLRKGRDFDEDTPIRLKGDAATLLWTPDEALAPKPAREVALEALAVMTGVWASAKALTDYGGVAPDAMRQALHRMLKEQPALVAVNSGNQYALVSRLKADAEKKV